MPADLSRPPTTTKSRRPTKKVDDDDKLDSAHAREIELKRSRGEISCAECRRLKIRCDKSIPCKSCQRRGCAALCPNGSLATGQGTRFVLAATEYLHKRIAKMNERVRQLEDALAILQARCSDEPHPLLRDDIVVAKAEQEDEDVATVEPANSAEIIDTFGTLSVSDHGVSRFFGPTGGTEYLLFTENNTPPGSPRTEGFSPDSGRGSMTPPINGELTRFSASFPLTPIGAPSEVQELIEQYLPRWERAMHLCETYLANAGWLFRGVTRQQLVLEMLPVVYRRPIAAGTPVASVDYTGPHDLALMFLVFALGALLDSAQDVASAEAEHYHHLARAALCLQPVLEKPSIVAIQALRLMSIYTAMAGKELRGSETTMETTWSLLALSAQLAHSIGLHRDSARWGLTRCMVNRRRLLFWDLYIGDVWQSLTTGRPPSFTRDYIDCKYPALQHAEIVDNEPEDPEDVSDEERNDFNTWGCRFAEQCVSEVAARALAAEPPSYATIMELDRKVREFAIPAEVIAMMENLKTPVEEEEAPSVATIMERMVLSHSREVVLLWIHRSHFAQAIIDCPSNPLRSQYASSFLATYRASTTILQTIKDHFAQLPILCARFWQPWTFAFSAAAVFGFVVTRGPRSPLAASAMAQLDTARELFAKAAVYNLRAAKALPMLTKWSEKAHAALNAARSGGSQDGEQWSVPSEDHEDELEIFAGKGRLVESKRPSPSPVVESRSSPPKQGLSQGPPQGQGQSMPPGMYNSGIRPTLHPPPVLPSLPQMTPSVPGPSRPTGNWPTQAGPQGFAGAAYDQPPRTDMFQSAGYAHSSVYAQSPTVGAGHMGYTWTAQAGPAQQQQQQQQQMQREAFIAAQNQQIQQQAYPDFAPTTAYPGAYAGGYLRSPERIMAIHQQAHGMPQQAYIPPPELIDLGLASRDSRLGERWQSFMHESGFLDGFDYDRTS